MSVTTDKEVVVCSQSMDHILNVKKIPELGRSMEAHFYRLTIVVS